MAVGKRVHIGAGTEMKPIGGWGETPSLARMSVDLQNLTPREREVIEAALQGGSIKSVADGLYVSPRTVEHHLSSAYRKLGVRNRTELLVRMRASLSAAPAPSPTPVTRYARSGSSHVAYQVVGDGEEDLVLIPGFVSNVETAWTWPVQAEFLGRLAERRRLIVFDKRGTGLSDPLADPASLTLEERMDEVRAVMDAADSRRAVLFGFSEGVALSLLFAATYPARTEGMILYGSLISGSLDADALGTATVFSDPDAAWELMQAVWGSGRFLAPFAPSAAGDPEALLHVARFERHGASPAAAYAIIRMAGSIEVRALCPAVHAPALVLHRREDALVPVANSRYLAERLPAARYVEFEGRDHPPWLGDTDDVLAEVDRFLAGELRRTAPPDGVLMALMAADRPLDPRALQAVERFRGRPVLSSAGTLYSFDGPVRAAACALSLTDPTRRLAVHAGEVHYTAQGLKGGAVDVLTALLGKARAGEPVSSTTLRELALGSGLGFESAGQVQVGDLGTVEALRLRRANSHDER